MKHFRAMRMQLNGANLQTMQFEGRDHIVVPVVLMVGDIVVHPMHSDGGEFVPAEVLAEAPAQWDGRPVVPGHPEGGTASANEPRILESQRFGIVFNTKFEDGRLKGQAWLDVARAEVVGPEAVDVIERLKAGEVVDISVGAWVTLEHKTGSAGGEKFRYRWTNVSSDHLAMLASDETGACSVDAGCGAPRANKDGTTKRAELRAANHETEGHMKWSIFTRVLEALGLSASQEAGDESVSDLMNALHDALRADEPAFEGVVEVFLDTSSVVFAASPEGPTQFFMREFSSNEDGQITLGAERVEVTPRTTFEPLSEEGDDDEGSTCGCGEGPCACGAGDTQPGDDKQPEPTTEEVVRMDKLKKLAARIIGCEASPFKEGDEEQLIAFGEDRLAELAEQYEEGDEPVGDPAPEGDEQQAAPEGETDDDDGDEADTVAVPREELDEMREALAERRAARQARQKSLAAKIVGKTDVYKEDDLLKRPVEELEQLAKALKCDEPVRDYSTKGAPIREDEDAVPPPPNQTAYARALKSGKNRQEAMEEARKAATVN